MTPSRIDMIEAMEKAAMEGLLNPCWSDACRVHGWRNYIGDGLRAIWATGELASREEWI